MITEKDLMWRFKYSPCGKGWVIDSKGQKFTRLIGQRLGESIIKAHNQSVQYAFNAWNNTNESQLIQTLRAKDKFIHDLCGSVDGADLSDFEQGNLTTLGVAYGLFMLGFTHSSFPSDCRPDAEYDKKMATRYYIMARNSTGEEDYFREACVKIAEKWLQVREEKGEEIL